MVQKAVKPVEVAHLHEASTFLEPPFDGVIPETVPVSYSGVVRVTARTGAPRTVEFETDSVVGAAGDLVLAQSLATRTDRLCFGREGLTAYERQTLDRALEAFIRSRFSILAGDIVR